LHVLPPQQVWPIPPHGTHDPLLHVLPAPQFPPPQHSWPTPPHAVHVPLEHTPPAAHDVPLQQRAPSAPQAAHAAAPPVIAQSVPGPQEPPVHALAAEQYVLQQAAPTPPPQATQAPW